MSDLIDRQAAIDSICRTVCDNPEICESPCDEIKVLEIMPSAQPTLYGYSIDHLALIADVMEKEGVSPEEAMRFFKDTQRIYQMLVDEIQKQVEGMVESCMT